MSEKTKDQQLEDYAIELGMNESEFIEFCTSVLRDKGYRVVGASNGGLTDPERFRQDMEDAGYEVQDYRGRSFWKGPAVYTDEDEGPTRQDVIRATSVKLMWDDMGRHFVVHPVEREGNWS